MATVGGTASEPRSVGWQMLGKALAFLLLVGVGITLATVVENPNKRLIQAVGGGIFLLVTVAVDTSYSLGVLMALLPFPAGTSIGTSNQILIFTLFIVHVVRQMVRNRPALRRSPIDLPIVVMVVAVLLSILHQQGDLKPLWREVRAFFSAFALFYLVVGACTKEEHVERLLVGFVVAMAASAGVGALQIFMPGRIIIPTFLYMPERIKHIDVVRASATFYNYSTFGQYMALAMILCSYLFVRSRSLLAKLMFMGILVFAAGTFISAAMRGAFFAMVFGLAYLVYRGRGEVKIKDWATMLVILAALVIFLGSVMVTYTGTGYLFERLSRFSLETGSPANRAEINRLFIKESLEYPFVGHGLSVGRLGGTGTTNPHCQYVYYFYTIGLVGLTGFVWAMLGLYVFSVRALSNGRLQGTRIRGLLTVFHTLTVVFIAHEMFDDYMDVHLYQHIAWSMFGMVVVMSRLVMEKPETETAGPTRRIGVRSRRRVRAG